MAVYKVPQDVEADDKLLGPFSFRQFVYLMIAGGLIAIAVGLFQIFPVLAIVPVPFVFFFLALALPLKKDQPMETYLAAIVSYHLKPRTRLWTPGQKESTIQIIAPKIVEDVRTRNISGEEATHRLSFLADIVDTGGYAIKGAGNNSMREDVLAEAEATSDMYDSYKAGVLGRAIDRDKEERHDMAITEMRKAIGRNIEEKPEAPVDTGRVVNPLSEEEKKRLVGPMNQYVENPVENLMQAMDGGGMPTAIYTVEEQVVDSGGAPVRPVDNGGVEAPPQSMQMAQTPAMQTQQAQVTQTQPAQPVQRSSINQSIMELMENKDLSVATIAKEANRIKGKDGDEIFVSLH